MSLAPSSWPNEFSSSGPVIAKFWIVALEQEICRQEWMIRRRTEGSCDCFVQSPGQLRLLIAKGRLAGDFLLQLDQTGEQRLRAWRAARNVNIDRQQLID